MRLTDIIGGELVTGCDIRKLKGTRNRADYRLACPDRSETKDRIINALGLDGTKHMEVLTSKSSVPVLDIWDDDGHHRLVFKPKTGGSGESTLNAAMTELIPCILFETGIKFEHFGDLQDQLLELDHSELGCYVTSKDMRAGRRFIEGLHNSSKFEEKMMNAMAVLRYLEELDTKRPIQQTYWSYRTKPEGCPPDSTADVVVEYEDGEMLGVSLKAGREYTSEPLLNTSIGAVYDFFEEDITPLRNELQKQTYTDLGINSWSTNRLEAYKILEQFEIDSPEEYERLYTQNVDIIRNEVIRMFSDINMFRRFARRKILKKCDEFPSVVIKLIKDEWVEIEDMSDLERIVEHTVGITASLADTRHGVLVDLLTRDGGKITMEFYVRTSKSGVRHKLGQFHALSVKYHGIRQN